MTYEFHKQCFECLNTEWCRLINDNWMCQHCYAYLTGDLE